MNLPEAFNFTLGGFSAMRVGYALTVASFAFVPAHFYVGCQASGAIAVIGSILFLAAGILSFVAPRATPHRFRPLALGLIAVVAHMLCAH